MKSTIVIYEHEQVTSKAAAKRIAYYLGAQTTCTHHIEKSILESVDNFVLCLYPCNGGMLSDEWKCALDKLTQHDLTGKTFAVFAEPIDGAGIVTPPFVNEVYKRLHLHNASIVARPGWKGRPEGIDGWISSVSPNF
ncbi:MAG: hypothetical protein IKX36_08515 [Prevotella sp.]|nr:hypothetical protein [Prevotella sp.]